METCTTFTNSGEIYIFATYFVFILSFFSDPNAYNSLPVAELVYEKFDWMTEATTMYELTWLRNTSFLFCQVFLVSL